MVCSHPNCLFCSPWERAENYGTLTPSAGDFIKMSRMSGSWGEAVRKYRRSF